MTGPAPSSLRPEHPVARPLAQLVADFGLDHRGDLDAIEVTGVALATTALAPGDLYVGVPGRHAHGASYAEKAAAAGAVAI
ncbi:MAG: UDP-N-acetylmuramoyl-L-alanyl-D-glutamate--2,6-diaminopimelate ligase, partial [Actinomycetales bacterium]